MKISVVGVGRVGTATAFSLVARAVPHELVLVGRTKDRTIGDAHDLQHAAAFVRPMRVVAGDVADTAGSDVVILAANAASGTFSDRTELAGPNARLLREIVPPLASASPRAVFVVLTNPVDVCTYVTLRSSGLPPGQVLGSGTLIDTARLRAHPALSVASVGGLSLDRKDEAMRAIVEEARNDGHRVVRAKGYTNYAVALSATMICEAIGEDARTILPVSALIDGYKGVSDVCLSLPCVVGRGGVLRVLPVDLDDEEVDQFRRSASVVRGVLDRLD
jgi:L-lactate dehydrogenase